MSSAESSAIDSRAWREFASCSGAEVAMFFGRETETRSTFDTRAAKKICGSCPVRAQCLAFAIEVDESHGVWGGMDPAERRRHSRYAFRLSRQSR